MSFQPDNYNEELILLNSSSSSSSFIIVDPETGAKEGGEPHVTLSGVNENTTTVEAQAHEPLEPQQESGDDALNDPNNPFSKPEAPPSHSSQIQTDPQKQKLIITSKQPPQDQCDFAFSPPQYQAPPQPPQQQQPQFQAPQHPQQQQPQQQAPQPPQQQQPQFQAPQQPQQQLPQQQQFQAPPQPPQQQPQPQHQAPPQQPQFQAQQQPQQQPQQQNIPHPQQQAPQPPQQQPPQQNIPQQPQNQLSQSKFVPPSFPQPQQQAPPPPKQPQAPPQHPSQPQPQVQKQMTSPTYLTPELLNEYYKLVTKCRQEGQDISTSSVPPEISKCLWDSVMWSTYYANRLRTPGANPHIDHILCGLRTLGACSICNLIQDKSLTQVVRSGSSAAHRTLRIESAHSGFKRVDGVEQVREPRRYGQTLVHVVNMDTLELARQLTHKHPGKKVACLNMANQYHPGGSWRSGRLAQEEQLFYRSTLSASLEAAGYPLGDYSAVLTRDVSVVREGLERGLAYYEQKDVWQTNFVTAAAFDLRHQYDQTLPAKAFTAERLVATRVKIESLVALCANEKMDVLVLSAFGCGVFRNPPQHMAAVFRAVIEQYAGYFEHVYFAIKGEPRTPNLYYFADILLGHNPTVVSGPGVLPISRVEDETIEPAVYAPRGLFTQSTAFTAASKGGNGARKPVCPSGSKCNIRNPEHYVTHIHPPMCPVVAAAAGGCCNKEFEHDLLFTHMKSCTTECEYAYGAHKEMHMKMFAHRELCSEGAACTKLRDQAHMAAFTHPARCCDGPRCRRRDEPEPGTEGARKHGECWTHELLPPCKDGLFCLGFGDHEHMESFTHPFLPLSPAPLSKEPAAAAGNISAEKCSQLCPRGPYCDKLGDPSHMQAFLHIGRACKMGDQCKDTSEAHLLTYRHPSACAPVVMMKGGNAALARREAFVYPFNNYPLPISHGRLPDYGANAKRMLAEVRGKVAPEAAQDYMNYVEWARRARPTVLLRVPNELDVYTELGRMYSLYTLLEEIPKEKFLWAFLLNSKATKDDARCVRGIVRQRAQQALATAKALTFDTGDLVPLLERVVAMGAEACLLSPEEIEGHLAGVADEALRGRLRSLGENIGALIQRKVEAPELRHHVAAGTARSIEACLGQVPYVEIYKAREAAAVVALGRNVMYHQSAFALPAPVARCPPEVPLQDYVASSATHPACEGWAEVVAGEVLRKYPKWGEFSVKWNNNNSSTSNDNPTLYLPGTIDMFYVSYAATPKKEGKLGSDGKLVFTEVAHDPSAMTQALIENDHESEGCNGATFVLEPIGSAGPQYVQCPVFVGDDNSGSGTAYLYFGATSTEFDLCITRDAPGAEGDVVISVDKYAASITHGSQKVENRWFNYRVCGDKPYVFYTVEIAPRSITLKHYSFSAVLNQETLRIEGGGGNGSESALFEGLRYVYARERVSEGVIPCTFYNMRCCGVDNTLRLRHFARVERNDDGYLEYAKSLRRCSDPFGCPVEMQQGHPAHPKHVCSYRHVCKMGASCREIGDPEHCKMYIHLKKPVCKMGASCREMNDPEHRLMFHHPNTYDFLLKCPNGPKCPQINSQQHCALYHHTGHSNGRVKDVLKKLQGEMK